MINFWKWPNMRENADYQYNYVEFTNNDKVRENLTFIINFWKWPNMRENGVN